MTRFAPIFIKRESVPFTFFDEFNKEFENILGKDLGAQRLKTWQEFQANQVETHESESAYLLSVDLPGVKKEDVKIDLEADILKITAQRKKRFSNGGEEEMSYSKSFTLPNNIDKNKIEAHLDEGVLTLALPKSENAKPKQIEINSGQKEKSWKSYLGIGNTSKNTVEIS